MTSNWNIEHSLILQAVASHVRALITRNDVTAATCLPTMTTLANTGANQMIQCTVMACMSSTEIGRRCNLVRFNQLIDLDPFSGSGENELSNSYFSLQ